MLDFIFGNVSRQEEMKEEKLKQVKKNHPISKEEKGQEKKEKKRNIKVKQGRPIKARNRPTERKQKGGKNAFDDLIIPITEDVFRYYDSINLKKGLVFD